MNDQEFLQDFGRRELGLVRTDIEPDGGKITYLLLEEPDPDLFRLYKLAAKAVRMSEIIERQEDEEHTRESTGRK